MAARTGPRVRGPRFEPGKQTWNPKEVKQDLGQTQYLKVRGQDAWMQPLLPGGRGGGDSNWSLTCCNRCVKSPTMSQTILKRTRLRVCQLRC